MASYRYTKDIDPALNQQEAPPIYTKKQKFSNWWHYNWKKLVVILLLLVVLAFGIGELLLKEEPDVKVGALLGSTGQAMLLPDLQEKVEEGLNSLLDDFSGDEALLLAVERIELPMPEEQDMSTASSPETQQGMPTVDPQMLMVGVTRLMGAFDSGEPVIYITAPQETDFYMAEYGIYTGSPVEEGEAPSKQQAEVSVRWADCPRLAALDLTTTISLLEEAGEIDGQTLLADMRIGFQPFESSNLKDKKDGEEIWQSNYNFYLYITQQE